MIRTKKRGMLIVVSGPSGCGKDSVVSELIKIRNNCYVSISCTSRSPRGSEVNGKDYFFLSRKEFQDYIDKDYFLEYAEYADNFYGTPKKNIERHLDNGEDVILIIEIQGALKIKEKVPDAIFLFILPPSMEELHRRLENRNTEDKTKIDKRFRRAYTEINEVSKYNYVIVNDEIVSAAKKIDAILTAERLRVDRIEEVYLNTIEESSHEALSNKTFDNNERPL